MGRERGSAVGFVRSSPPNGGIEERFLSARADPFAGSEWGKKKSGRSVRNDGWVLAGSEREGVRSEWEKNKVGPLRSKRRLGLWRGAKGKKVSAGWLGIGWPG
jgi:hypothetical protein